jgi:hypothetical protein
VGRTVIEAPAPRATQRRTGRVRAVRRTIVVGCALTAVLVAAGCAKKANTGGTSAPPTGLATSPAASPSIGSEEGAGAAPVLPDGRHPVYLTGLDVAGRKVTFDLIQFLTGEEAKKAWVAAHPDEPDGPPNDYFIVNQNPKLRTMDFAEPVTVVIVDMSGGGVGSKEISLAALPARLVETTPAEAGDKRLSYNPYWLTVAHNKVTRIEEQFLP